MLQEKSPAQVRPHRMSIPCSAPRTPAIFRSRAVRIALLATMTVGLLRVSVVDWRRVSGASMAPTLASGQLLACNRLAYGLRLPGMADYLIEWSAPKPGEIVIYSSPTDGQCCVKRVSAPPVHLGALGDEVWVLGDNSEESCDSRDHGPLPVSLIHGRAHVLPFVFSAGAQEALGGEN